VPQTKTLTTVDEEAVIAPTLIAHLAVMPVMLFVKLVVTASDCMQAVALLDKLLRPEGNVIVAGLVFANAM
jgi:hypothetical protein